DSPFDSKQIHRFPQRLRARSQEPRGFLVLGSWFLALGSWFLVLRSWLSFLSSLLWALASCLFALSLCVIGGNRWICLHLNKYPFPVQQPHQKQPKQDETDRISK